MKFCPACGQPVEIRIPAGDHLPRSVCTACGTVHYENPKLVVGCFPEAPDGRLLLCRRAIEPRHGFWTAPAGFMEIGESLQQAAQRETREEALAAVRIGTPLAIVHVLHAAQVHVLFRARLIGEEFGAGAESLEVALFEEAAIPWDDLAFRSVEFALRRLLEDRRAGREPLHFTDLTAPPAAH